jgi:hypothetical protein
LYHRRINVERVMCVDAAQAAILESKPPQVAITADGKVPTSGWTNPELSLWFYVVPPSDGIQDFDFVAHRRPASFFPSLRRSARLPSSPAIRGTTGARASR